MDVYRPLRAILFGYEVVRLLVLIGLYTAFAGAEGGGAFPYLVFAAPNALFVLMSFFLLLDLAAYRSYLTLYRAGKIVTAAAFIAWGLLSLRGNAWGGLAPALAWILWMGSSFISLGDVLSIPGSWMLMNRLKRAEEPCIGGV
jgi:hypothetical protein